MNYKKMIENNIDSFNSYSPGQRSNMLEGLMDKIKQVEQDITNVYKREASKKYPLRNSYNNSQAGEQKRSSALQFVTALKEGLYKKDFQSESFLLQEIKDAINRDDKDYASGLIDSTDMLLKPDNSKFFTDYSEIRKTYLSNLGLENIGAEIQELKTRKAEFEFIIDSILKQESFIILPRQFDELFNQVDLSKNPTYKEASIKLVPYVNKAMSFLSSKNGSLL